MNLYDKLQLYLISQGRKLTMWNHERTSSDKNCTVDFFESAVWSENLSF